MLFGCQPSTGVNADTTMVFDVSAVFEEMVDPETHSLIFPQALEEITGQDASFEIAQSNTLVPIRLMYEHNFVYQA